KAQLIPSRGADPISGDALGELARKYLVAEAVIDRLSGIIAEGALRAILGGVEIELTDEKAARESAARLEAAIAALNIIPSTSPPTRVEAEFNEKLEQWRLKISKTRHGNVRVSYIEPEFLLSADYRALLDSAQTVSGLIGEGGEIRRGEGDKMRSQSVRDFHSAMRWLLADAERGVTRQRYKGLGEMNAEQLWETTMDASSRRLLKVQVEDLIAADEIFTTLMGDDVEPRRAFIEQNALGARNIDV